MLIQNISIEDLLDSKFLYCMFRCSSKKITDYFSVTSNLAVAALIVVGYSSVDLLLQGVFELKQVTKSLNRSKNNPDLEK